MLDRINRIFAQKENRLIGLGLAAICFFSFSALDALTKHLTADYPQVQITWFRFAAQAMVALPLLWLFREAKPWRTKRPGVQFMRGVAIAGTTFCNTIAVTYLPLSLTGAMFFTSPFIVAALSIPLLGERIGWRRWLAIIIGFSGVLVVLRPFNTELHWAILVAMMSPMFFALLSILNRKVAHTEHFATMFFFMTLVGTIGFFPLMVQSFVWIDWQGLLLLTGPGILGAFGHGLFIIAARYCPAPILAPVIYTELLYLMSYDILLFNYVPDAYVLLGSGIIAGCGMFIFMRERAVKKI